MFGKKLYVSVHDMKKIEVYGSGEYCYFYYFCFYYYLYFFKIVITIVIIS